MVLATLVVQIERGKRRWHHSDQCKDLSSILQERMEERAEADSRDLLTSGGLDGGLDNGKPRVTNKIL